MSRRGALLAATAAAAIPLKAQEPAAPPKTPADELEAAKQAVARASAQLGKLEVSQDREPAFVFRVL